jgi:ElaB/YqjD/DUF883 family membrane-anchored ribosome-binding protein
MDDQACCGGSSRLKSEFDSFSSDVQKIFVDSSVAVIDKVRQLADGAFDDLKGLVDTASDKTKKAGDAAADYVRRNPWKAAAAFIILGVAVSAMSSRNKGPGRDEPFH